MQQRAASTGFSGARTTLPIVAGSVLSLLVFVVAYSTIRHSRQEDARQDAEHVFAALQTRLATPMETVQATSAFLRSFAGGAASLAQFRAFAAPALERHPEIVALEWVVRVPGELRAQFESLVREEQPSYEIREPTRAGAMVRAVDRAMHLPLVYSEPLTPAVHGLDLAFDAARAAPVERAFKTNRVTLSDRYQLVEDPDGVYSVAAYQPVPAASWSPKLDARLRSGVVVGLFRLKPLFERALRGVDMSGTSLQVDDPVAPPELQPLYRYGPPLSEERLTFTRQLRFADRNYRVSLAPRTASVGAGPWLALGLGLAVTALVEAYTRAARRVKSLAQRVAQLGQYTIKQELAKGGMGTVYLAEHALLRRDTAVKIAHSQQVGDFEREARITCALNHPNTVQIYDFGRSDGGLPYLAMEYVSGFHLEELVELCGALPPARAARIMIQVAGSLAEAHERGLVHRDIKPRNVMVTERGGVRDFVKVLDFGLARTTSVRAGDHRALFEGTPGYAAPELARGVSANPLSDTFSFGCVAYFLLAGRAPFPLGSSLAETLTSTLTSNPEPLPSAVPPSLCELVFACMSKNPAARPGPMPALANRLRSALAECPPWTQQDADQWWLSHQPELPSGALGEHQRFSIMMDSQQRRPETTKRPRELGRWRRR